MKDVVHTVFLGRLSLVSLVDISSNSAMIFLRVLHHNLYLESDYVQSWLHGDFDPSDLDPLYWAIFQHAYDTHSIGGRMDWVNKSWTEDKTH
jgi:hypothetical protein